MKCPYCQEEMQLGYIPNGGQPVQWIPNGERPSVLSFSIAEQGVPLINQFIANIKFLARFVIRTCHIFIPPNSDFLLYLRIQIIP